MRDCLTGLTSSKEPAEATACLRAAATLIRTQQSDTKEIAELFASALVSYPNDFALHDYHQVRRDALLALVIVAPAQAGVFLAKDLQGENWTTRHRLDMLQVILGSGYLNILVNILKTRLFF